MGYDIKVEIELVLALSYNELDFDDKITRKLTEPVKKSVINVNEQIKGHGLIHISTTKNIKHMRQIVNIFNEIVQEIGNEGLVDNRMN